jgi:DNA polymerase-3 subunit gamma/tau
MDKPFNRGVEDLAGGELAGNMPAKVSAMDKSFNRGVEGLAGAVDAASGVVLDSVATTVARASGRPDPVVALDQMSTATWPELAARLPLTGLAAELAHQSAWVGVQDGIVTLQVAVKTLADSASRTRLQTALCAHFGLSIGLAIKVGKTGSATAHAVAQHEGAARQQAAEAAAAADPFVQGLLSNFGGYIVPGSIRHRDPPPEASC